ncbi:MAG: amidohydrolase family protein, partial [Desulfuromonadaceae bacterium]
LFLVDEGVLTLNQLIEKMSCNPSNILGLNRATLKAGSIADITLIDPAIEWVVEADKLASKSKNSPWLGQKLKGGAAATIVNGKVVYKR